MEFSNLRIKELHSVVDYSSQQSSWKTVNRTTHFVGIEVSGNSVHDLGYQKFTLSENCLFFFNQKDDYSVTNALSGRSIAVHFTTFEPISTPTFIKKIKDPAEALRLLRIIDRYKKLGKEKEHLAISYLQGAFVH